MHLILRKSLSLSLSLSLSIYIYIYIYIKQSSEQLTLPTWIEGKDKLIYKLKVKSIQILLLLLFFFFFFLK